MNVARLLPVLLAVITICCFSRVSAQGEHSRIAASELLIVSADIQRLSGNQYTDIQKQGLAERIAGGLAGLEILLRLADQEKGSGTSQYGAIIRHLRGQIARNEYSAAVETLVPLLKSHPLRAPGITTAQPTGQAIDQARAHHEELCAGCHDDPELDTNRPAYNLYSEVRKMQLAEFTARMIIGIRGDRITGITNPFTDAELAALIAFYRAGPATQP